MAAGARRLTLFVDSSAFYAAADRGDRGHRTAAAALTSGEPLVTSDHVVVETWLLLQRQLGHAAAEAWWSALRGSGSRIESVGPADVEAAWAIGEAFTDQRFSIVDRTSFAVMQRLGILRVASFDDDFAIFRFGPRRERAFELVR